MRIQRNEEDGLSNNINQNEQIHVSTSAFPDVSYLSNNFVEAIGSFYRTIDQIITDNPVDLATFGMLKEKIESASASEEEIGQFESLKIAAQRQGRAIAAVIGFFLKFKPYAMFAEIREKESVFQPMFGPVLVVEGDAVRDVLSRHHEFTVDPYGAEMSKAMTPDFNGGFNTFVLSTDSDDRYIEDKQLLSKVVAKDDMSSVTEIIHRECQTRVKNAVMESEKLGSNVIDVVPTVARFIPVVLSHHYLGVPAVAERGSFELDDDMLKYYGDKVMGPDGKTPLPTSYHRADGSQVDLPDSALSRNDGVIPDEQQIYEWIVAAFKHFFNNVQKDIEVQARGVRAYRELLVYILREIKIQRKLLLNDSDTVADNMLSRLLKIQMGLPIKGEKEPVVVDQSRVTDLRIAENVMGTIVGAVAGQEEATCRVIDSMIRLKEGDFESGSESCSSNNDLRYGDFDHAQKLAMNVVAGCDVQSSRAELMQYVDEALRLQPQGEVLLRLCVKDGVTISDSQPIKAGTLVFAGHGSAMQDIEQPSAFILGRTSDCYLQYGFGRHKCLGQYVSPILISEALIALLPLKNLRRPAPKPDESAFPLEGRFGRLQLDQDNLYAKTFSLAFDS